MVVTRSIRNATPHPARLPPPVPVPSESPPPSDTSSSDETESSSDEETSSSDSSTSSEDTSPSEETSNPSEETPIPPSPLVVPSVSPPHVSQVASVRTEQEEEQDEIQIVEPAVAAHPCRECYARNRACLVLPGEQRCTSCDKAKSGCNHGDRLPEFRGPQADIRKLIYGWLYASALRQDTYVPPKVNPRNDWTDKYLRAMLTKEQYESAIISEFLNRNAAEAPGAEHPGIASGSRPGTRSTPGRLAFNPDELDTPTKRRRAREAHDEEIARLEKELYRIKRNKTMLQALINAE
ncbi:hypothetical protein OC846_006967, partial [Tilletia horrida]